MLSPLPAVLLAAALAGSAFAANNPAQAPADPQLNPKGRALLTWFQQLQASPALQLVSGQFCGWSGTPDLREADKIHAATGQWPAMIGLDYCTWREGGVADIDPTPPNRLARQYWQDGGLVDISWHAPNPANPKGGGLSDKGVNLRDLLVPGPTHDRWMQSLDRVAAGLQELQQAGVVVIWRPLHEMNGAWFWWGAKEPADFIALWRHMFDYFTREKHLHNLVWAYAPNHGPRTTDYYPGDAYADLTGLDAYTDLVNPDRIKGYPDLARISKPTGFTEYGPHASSSPPGDFDFRRFLDGVEKHFPSSRHFLVWNEKWNPAENRFAREFYNDPRIITRAQLPAGLAGR